MAMHYKKEIISPEVLQELYPLTPEQKKAKTDSRPADQRDHHR